jgi:lipoprotein-releasing system ATP-binding protein
LEKVFAFPMPATYSKPNVRLTSSLKQPNGRPLFDAPTINFDELIDGESRQRPTVLPAELSTEPLKRESLRLPFLYEKVPQIDVPPVSPHGTSLSTPTAIEKDAVFERRLSFADEPKPQWDDLPALPEWDFCKKLHRTETVNNNVNNTDTNKTELSNTEPPIEIQEEKNITELEQPSTAEVGIPRQSMDIPLLQAESLSKSYYKKKLKIPVLKGVDFSVRKGEFVSIVGQSGSGKSTLLHLLGTLDNPEFGSILFEGQRVDNLSIKKRDKLRNYDIGFIFQFYHLLPELTTLENVLSPLMIREGLFGYFTKRRKYTARAKDILDKVGLSHRLKHKPCELSGGEMQRAAIARALIAEPKILLADEPTGNLDSVSAKEIIELLQTFNRDHNVTIVMVTHDNSIAAVADRIVKIADGKIVS